MRGYGVDAESDGVVATSVRDTHRQVELLLPDADADRRRLDRACRRALAERRAWLSVITAEPDRTVDQVREHGLRVLEVQTLMSAVLSAHPTGTLADGLSLEVDGARGHVRVRVQTDEGTLAGSGQAGLVGVDMVADRIHVDPSSRRRGVATAVMSALAATAAAQGASTGLLVASPEGRPLYEALGWTRVADVVVADQG